MMCDRIRQGAIRWGVICGVLCCALGSAWAAEFSSAWPEATERTWTGPEYFPNRMLDWRVRDGRLECVEGSKAKPMRTIHLLTRALGGKSGTVVATVRTGSMDAGGEAHHNTWTGFLLGVGGEHVDFRISALCHHWPAEDGGLIAAIDGTGRLIFRDNSQPQKSKQQRGPESPAAWPLLNADADQPGGALPDDVELRLEAEPRDGKYRLTLSARDVKTGAAIGRTSIDGIDPQQLSGNIALISHNSSRQEGPGYWFRDWRLSGSKVEAHEDRALGPVFTALHTLSRGTLKMTAQMGALGGDDSQQAELQVQRNGRWETAATGKLIDHSFTIPFRVENWDDSKDTPYRVAYELRTGPGSTETCYYSGTIRRPPGERDEFVVAAFTGQGIAGTNAMRWNHNRFWYPHSELAAAAAYHKPDLLFFSGDQIYEGGLAGIVRKPADMACVDYLYHWVRWCWTFRDLTRDVPAICLPDDHDVYHGNIWGARGVRVTRDPKFKYMADGGGYNMEPLFVNAVHRTQTSHLPDPVDPEPIAHGITVYFTRMEYAGFSFAILADRMWKSAPAVVMPEGQVANGWFQNPEFDPVTQADVPGAVLLGERQLRFLEHWANDWSDEAYMKVALSQTIFSNVATLPEEARHDGVVPGLRYAEPGEYIEGDVAASDCDTNGWPQTGRNNALRAMRRGFAFHIAGDQHLASFIQYGIDEWGDAPYAFCVPSVANVWPRRWYPPTPGHNRAANSPKYTGEFKDGFGNRMTVFAVANPVKSGVEPTALYDRNPGYGIVRLNRSTRKIVSECWPRWVDPSQPGAKQYAGWPVEMSQFDNYGRTATALLPTLEITGMSDPVVQLVHESDGEIIYTVRIKGTVFQPKVFKDGSYTLKVGEPGTPRMKVIEEVRPIEPGESTSIQVEL